MGGVSERIEPPSLVGRWPASELATVRLVRHGQTRTYQSDSGLTEVGRQQAYAKGAALAGTLAPGAHVWLPHAPTARAAETATAVRDGIADNLGSTAPERVRLDEPYIDTWFDNLRVWCDGRALDPTQAYATYRARRADTSPDRLPGWFAEMDRFFSLQTCGEDPITFWLTQPLQHFEPASVAVRRFWTGIQQAVRTGPEGLHLLVSTHSGCIRAVAAAAFGYDPGEPRNTEDVTIQIPRAADRAVLAYRGRAVELAVPAETRPPWCATTQSIVREG
ncbi:Broad specificity phosphatase PhoE [Haloechinothrix alba]|uniref:Broad specificity phosphatase PhoE n=2 Tax=Haloechinothrix alba TaxID=664784 RepID=A0A238X2R7_9PSEU|nr:Broad specificity phosphatase PhoE [Haloechinothrix alba]